VIKVIARARVGRDNTGPVKPVLPAFAVSAPFFWRHR